MIPSLAIALTSISLLALQAGTAQWGSHETLLSSHEMSLDKRYAVPSVNDVFKDNILLTLAYLDGRVKSKADINWDYLRRPYMFEFRLNPGESFAFHDTVLPQYSGKIVKSTTAHFNSLEGFKSDGYLIGDGVCHLASLIDWSAKDAGLDVLAPTRHDFANIPEISKENGVAIYSGQANQNLYITNNLDKPVIFRFQYIDNELTSSVLEVN